jgi:hypothetical protein
MTDDDYPRATALVDDEEYRWHLKNMVRAAMDRHAGNPDLTKFLLVIHAWLSAEDTGPQDDDRLARLLDVFAPDPAYPRRSVLTSRGRASA